MNGDLLSEALRAQAQALWALAEVLEGGQGGSGGAAGGVPCPRGTGNPGTGMDLSARDLGAHFDRSASWAKAEIRAGRFDGAYRLPNREWRVPEASVEAYRAAQRGHGAPIPASAGRRRGGIADWRKLRGVA